MRGTKRTEKDQPLRRERHCWAGRAAGAAKEGSRRNLSRAKRHNLALDGSENQMAVPILHCP